MELLTNIIAGYLKHNKRLVVPRFGAFIVKQPSGDIIFSELMRNDDGVLRSLLVAYGCNELAANGMIDRFSFEIRHKISHGEAYVIPNFGEFSDGGNNTIRFKQRVTPKVYGGNIKPPLECFNEEKLKLQRIQRIRQQQCENLTGHSTHRKLKTSQAIITNKQRGDDDQDIDMGKPDKYLRGLKYENRKGRNSEEEHYGNDRTAANGSSRIVFLVLIAIIIGLGGYLIWQWLEKSNAPEVITTIESPAEPVIEPQDSLATPELTEPEVATPAVTTTPATTPTLVTPLLPTSYLVAQPNTAATTSVEK
jgi:nucleoid DNA-binding protein